MSCHAGQETLAGQHLQNAGVRDRNRRTAPRCRDTACISAPRQSAWLRRSAHTAPLQRYYPWRISCSTRPQQRYHPGSRRYLISSSISRWAETLRPDLIRVVTGVDKEARSTFNERGGAANVTSRDKVRRPGHVGDQISI